MKPRWTRRLVVATILAEVSGKPQVYVESMLEVCLPRSPQADNEIPESEALTQLEALRKEKAGILNWLIKGRRDAMEHIQRAASRN